MPRRGTPIACTTETEFSYAATEMTATKIRAFSPSCYQVIRHFFTRCRCRDSTHFAVTLLRRLPPPLLPCLPLPGCRAFAFCFAAFFFLFFFPLLRSAACAAKYTQPALGSRRERSFLSYCASTPASAATSFRHCSAAAELSSLSATATRRAGGSYRFAGRRRRVYHLLMSCFHYAGMTQPTAMARRACFVQAGRDSYHAYENAGHKLSLSCSNESVRISSARCRRCEASAACAESPHELSPAHACRRRRARCCRATSTPPPFDAALCDTAEPLCLRLRRHED